MGAQESTERCRERKDILMETGSGKVQRTEDVRWLDKLFTIQARGQTRPQGYCCAFVETRSLARL